MCLLAEVLDSCSVVANLLLFQPCNYRMQDKAPHSRVPSSPTMFLVSGNIDIDEGCLNVVRRPCRDSRRTTYFLYRTVVRECFKGDEASPWKRPKFDPSPQQNPLTDLHKNWQA